ncbi:MAG: YcxB family protein [Tyzzerella sp.]|nr:YcxB family protein [Tyzzerella sp.]
MENIELQEGSELKKGKYVASVKRDEKLLKTFVKFSNQARHPRTTVYMITVGAMLIALPIANKGIALPGVIICYVMGTLMVLIGLFRHYIGTYMLKSNPQTKLGEEITYIFGNTDIKTDKAGVIEKLGSYSKIYRLWEDEKHFYIGINEDDLVVLPKNDFITGEVSEFRDFLLEKSGATYTWQPTRIDNVIKHNINQFKWNMQKQREEAQQRAEERVQKRNKK